MSKVDRDRHPVSAEIEAVREQEIFRISEHESRDGYQELLIKGSPSDEYDPVALLGVFPFLSTKGNITLDLVDLFRPGAPDDELGYLRRVQALALPRTSGSSHGIISKASLDFQMPLAMRELALRNKPSAVLAFSRDAVHLFYPVVLPPLESLSQLKSTAELGIKQQT